MVTSISHQTILNQKVQSLLSQEFQEYFNHCQDIKEPSEWRRNRRSMGELLHVITLTLLTETSARNWLEIQHFQQTNYTKIKPYVCNFGIPFRPGTLYTKLNYHLKMDVFVPSFIDWTEAIAEATNHQVEPLSTNEAAIVRTMTNRQSWRVLGLIRFWINKNPDFKVACRRCFDFTA